MDVVQLNVADDNPVTLPNGDRKSPSAWAAELGLSYFPSIVFYDEQGAQVAMMNAYFRNFHTQSIFAYVLEKAYLEQPSFQRYIGARAEHLNEQGIDVDSSGNVILNEASSDSRLSKFTTTTLGLKYGYALGKNSEISVRGEFMNQAFDDAGARAGEETPDLDAVIVNVGYSFLW